MSAAVAEEQSTDSNVELPAVESIKLEGAVLDPVNLTNEQEFNGHCGITLETLPYELLLLVFNYVDAGHLIRSVSKVCQKFHVLLSSETYWKTRLTAWYSPDRYPPVSDLSEDFDWQEACLATEESYGFWRNNSQKTECIRISNMSSGFSDSVHFLKGSQLLLVGSRDHSLTVMDVDKLVKDQPNSYREAILYSDHKCHKGWVWCLNSYGNQFCSGCWDSNIRLWDSNPNIALISTFRCNSAVLDIYMEPNLIVAGTHFRTMCTIDTREGVIHEEKLHRMPVLCLAVTQKYIITGSEDSQICVFDRKAGSVFKKIALDEYPMCLTFNNNHLWVGDHVGKIHLFDATDDQFNLVMSHDLRSSSNRCKLTTIRHSMGALFTSSNERNEGKITIMEPTANLQRISCISPNFGEIAGLDHSKNTLAYAGSNCCVEIWKPKPQL
ncbi:F-box/WD repeat-containing protein 9 [Octopus sinensis]|uniref:F-box/WD repeat-containing protein 9 n=1 Tax=Octopus sinensis TaxID=2607531 RepID=A0A6P7TLN7_9MOLL|nr:F-box/WD repeat-containing protein 9 [Octopus sinensis]XP_036368387.1 F-box/WD repeat-containing protein 9 [Octopus sinensis]XP_036368388.1 F-box/WD repeat-containing protein 9 [Octopus sinensis]XP_036368389.1 F-box/WD repeat-containing protein 9 [Octopus sinensis]